MARSPKIAFPGSLVFVTTRTQRGLPFASNRLIELIIYSCLSRAQSLYPVTICHFIVMANHVHFLMVVRDPEELIRFMDHFKTESSHAINRLLGRRQISLWCDGFHCATVLTKEDAINTIAYIYANPQKADLVERIEDYPGVSSFGMYQSKKLEIECPRIRRHQIEELVGDPTAEALRLKRESNSKERFKLAPDAWMKVFGEEDRAEAINTGILEKLRLDEATYKEKRKKVNKPCLGRASLMNQPIDKEYRPNKFGRKMWCISWDVSLKVAFISFVKDLVEKGRKILSQWKVGDTSAKYPLGIFPPSMPRLGNLVPPVQI